MSTLFFKGEKGYGYGYNCSTLWWADAHHSERPRRNRGSTVEQAEEASTGELPQ